MTAKALMECGDNALLLAIEVSRAGGEFVPFSLCHLTVNLVPGSTRMTRNVTIDWPYAIFSRRCFSGQ